MHNMNHSDQRKDYVYDNSLYSRRIPAQIYQNTVSYSNRMVSLNQAYVVTNNFSKNDFEEQLPSEEEIPDEILMQRKNMLLEYIGYLDDHKMLPWQDNYSGPNLASRIDLNNFAEFQRSTQSLTVDEVDEAAEEQKDISGFVEDIKANNSGMYYQLAAKALAMKVIRLQSIIQAHDIEMPVDLKMEGLTSKPFCQREPTCHNTLKEANREEKTYKISNVNLKRSSNALPKHNKCSALFTHPNKTENSQDDNICSTMPTFSKYGRNMLESQNPIIQRTEDYQNTQQLQFSKPLPQPTINNIAGKCPLTEANELEPRFKKYMKKRSREESHLSQLQGNRRKSKVPRRSQFQTSISPESEQESDDEQLGLEAMADFIELLAAVVNKKTKRKAGVKPSSRNFKKHNETQIFTGVQKTPVIPPNLNNDAINAIKKTEKQPIKGIKRDIAMLPNADAHHASNDYFLYDSDAEDFDFESDESD